jgi:hypothetical protein
VTTAALWLIGGLTAGLVIAAAWWQRKLARLRRDFTDFIRDEAPEMTIRGATPTGISVEILGVGVDVDLASLARRRRPGRSDTQWFAEVADGLRARAPRPGLPPLALVQDRIMPLLRPARYARLFDRYGPAQKLAWREVDAEVACTYVVTGMHQVTSVTVAARDAWGMTAQALHAQAVANLRAQTAHVLSELDGPRRVYEHIDVFDATRLLVAEMLVPRDVQDAVFAIPEGHPRGDGARARPARAEGDPRGSGACASCIGRAAALGVAVSTGTRRPGRDLARFGDRPRRAGARERYRGAR